jgi:hypothetical protein
VIELELLQRHERPVALLLEREPAPLRLSELVETLALGPAAEKRACDEPNGDDGEEPAEDESGGENGYASAGTRP